VRLNSNAIDQFVADPLMVAFAMRLESIASVRRTKFEDSRSIAARVPVDAT